MLGRPPLGSFSRFECDGFWVLGYSAICRSLPDPKILVFVDSFLAPFHLDLSQGSCFLRFFEAFNVPARWSLRVVHPFLLEDHLTLVTTLQAILVCLSGCTLQVSPLCRVGDLQAFLRHVVDGYQHKLWNPDQALAVTESGIVRLDLPLKACNPLQVSILIGLDFRVIDYVPGELILAAVQRAFPFGLSDYVRQIWHCQGQAFIPLWFPALPGSTFQVWYRPKQFLVEPFGLLWFDPFTTLAQVQKYCSLRFFGGTAEVVLRVNNQLLRLDAPICWADGIGILRGSVYPLKGGVLTVGAAEEMIQEHLVGHGASVSHAKSTADHLVHTAGMAAIKKALEHKDAWGQLKALASKSNIVLVKYLDRPVDPLQVRDPWSNYKEQRSRTRGPKASDKVARDEQVTDSVDLTFFHANGSELLQVTIEQLFQGISGLATCDFAEEGAKYIREVTGRSLSVKASGLLFTGVPPSDFEISKHGNAANLVVPVWLNGKPAALQCVLFQTGDVQVSYHLTVKATASGTTNDGTLMIHVYRDEVSQEGWEAFESLAAYLRTLGFNAAAYLKHVWAVGFYDKNRRCVKERAQYCHGFVKVPDGRHLELLKLSGTRGFYCSSRSAERSTDHRYRVIWLDGLSHEEAMLQLHATVDHAGLVRTRRGFGIRVCAAQYASTRQKLLPGAPESSESEAGGDKKFRLMGVPKSTDRSGLKRVLHELGWPAKVVRSQGFQCWVVTSAVNPPHRSFSIDEAQVVITAEMQQVHPVVGGDKALRAQAFNLVNVSSAGCVLPTPPASMQSAVDEVTQSKFATLEKRLEAVEKNTAKTQ